MYMLEGVSSVANFITAYEESKKPRLPFFICNVLFVSKGNLLDFYFNKSCKLSICRIVKAHYLEKKKSKCCLLQRLSVMLNVKMYMHGLKNVLHLMTE